MEKAVWRWMLEGFVGLCLLTARKGHSKQAVGSNHVGRKPHKPGEVRTGNCSLVEFLDS